MNIIVKKAEAKASKWVYENAKSIYQHEDSLSNELYDFFKAYVLLQHNRDSIKFLYAYETIRTALTNYHTSDYFGNILDMFVEKAIYDFQFDNEMLLRILIDISSNCYLSYPTNDEDDAIQFFTL